MNIKRLVRTAIVATAVGAAVVGLAPTAAQALPSGCAALADEMRRDVNFAHAARIRHDYATWQAYQWMYQDAWYQYQDAGC